MAVSGGPEPVKAGGEGLSRAGILLLFVLYASLAAAVYVPAPVLYDSDAYYHLAVARLVAAEGAGARVPWATRSMIGEGGDKELLFHLLLAPFSTLGTAGGRLALAALNGAIGAVIGVFAIRALGRAGAIVPVWLWIAAPPFFGRVARLRPELPALLLILLALLPSRRRSLQIGVLSFLFTLSYTAWHVFLALVIVWCVIDRTPRAAIAGMAGTLLGLFARPYPVETLRIWWVQNVEFFVRKSSLNVGNEITAPDAWYLQSSVVFVIACAALIVFARSAPSDAMRWRDSEVLRTASAAALFSLLFVFMSRMAVYAYPLVLLSVLAWLAGRLDPRRATGILALTGLIALPIALQSRAVRVLSGEGEPEKRWQAAGAAIPSGATVAANWEISEHFAWFAPQARFLNVLDPIFMALPYPREYRLLQDLLSGREPDVPRAILALGADHLLLVRSDAPAALLSRLRDPRLEVRSDGEHVLARVRGDRLAAREFLRVAAGQCQTFRRVVAPHAAPIEAELAPYGPTRLHIDGRLRAASRGVTGAIVGRGFRFELAASARPQVIEIETCRAPDGIGGTYLVMRPEQR